MRDGAANANTRGNLALVYGLAGREKDARATLARRPSPRGDPEQPRLLPRIARAPAKGKPIGNLGQPVQGTKVASASPKAAAPAAAPANAPATRPGAPLSALDPLATIIPVAPASPTLPSLAAKTGAPATAPIAALPKTPEIKTQTIAPAATAAAAPPKPTTAQPAAPTATAEAPKPAADFVPASGALSPGISIPDTPIKQLPTEPAVAPTPLPLPTTAGE